MRIGYQGDLGSNNHRAFLEIIKIKEFTNAQGIPLITSQNVINNLKNKKIDYGLVAISNILTGKVAETTLALSNFNYTIIHTLDLPIIHTIAIHEKSSNVNVICSHIQALKQCSNWIGSQNTLEYKDTGLAAKDLSEGILPKDTAVICSPLAAQIYNLKVLHHNISNLENNYTTFILFSPK